MISLRLSAVFAAITLILLVFLQLLGMVQHTEQIPESSFTRNFNRWKSRTSAAAAADNLFLVGAGKADVTGYGLFITL